MALMYFGRLPHPVFNSRRHLYASNVEVDISSQDWQVYHCDKYITSELFYYGNKSVESEPGYDQLQFHSCVIEKALWVCAAYDWPKYANYVSGIAYWAVLEFGRIRIFYDRIEGLRDIQPSVLHPHKRRTLDGIGFLLTFEIGWRAEFSYALSVYESLRRYVLPPYECQLHQDALILFNGIWYSWQEALDLLRRIES